MSSCSRAWDGGSPNGPWELTPGSKVLVLAWLRPHRVTFPQVQRSFGPHSFKQKVFIESLQRARHCASPHGACSVVGSKHQLNGPTNAVRMATTVSAKQR